MDRTKWNIIGVIGSRERNEYTDEELVFNAMKKLWIKNTTIVCSGGCSKGADSFAKKLCYLHQLPYLEFPAEWSRRGKGAGFVRNTDIAGWSDFLIACVSKDRVGGTEDTIQKFVKINGDEKLILV